MYEHHQRTIDSLRERFASDPEVLALVIVGSVARGDARPDSDVDCYLVVGDAEYRRRLAGLGLSVEADDLADYPNGHASGVVVD